MPTVRDLKVEGLTNREVMEVMIWLYNFQAPYVPWLLNLAANACISVDASLSRPYY